MRNAIVLLLPLLGACSYSLQGEIENARAEIVEIERKVPPEAPLWIFEGPDRFDAFLDDFTPGIPDFLYHHLLKKLHGMASGDVDGQTAGEFDAEECRNDPAAFRGKIWRVHGLIGELHAEALSDRKHPVATAHAGVMFDSHLRPLIFHVTQKPEVLTLRQDAVETRAVFVKWVEYTSRSGRKVSAPFFVGKTLRRYL